MSEAIELEAEVVRLRRLLEEPEFVRAEIDRVRGDTSFDFKGLGAKVLAASLADFLGDAPNFVTCEVVLPDDEGKVEVTVRRAGGKSPGQVIAELEAEIGLLRYELDRAMGVGSPAGGPFR